jgi:enoyl-[acyl-carrier protein] reductase II
MVDKKREGTTMTQTRQMQTSTASTALTLDKVLGIKYPFIQGGMANIATGEFAAAVSEAGALGMIAAGGMNIEVLRENIQRAKRLTDKPFGVNLMMMHRDIEAQALLLAEEAVAVVSTGAGNPAAYVERWKDAGSFVFPVIPSVALGKSLARCGVDAVIAEGTESGGHVGELTTMTLVPQTVAALDLPVIAAGGIASGAQYLAVRSLGAIGAQMGTCLLVSEECPIHENYKQAILKAHDTSTVVIGRIAGRPVRELKNMQARAYLKLEKAGADKNELEELTLGALRRAVYQGDMREGSFMAGQVAGQLSEIRPLREIFAEIYSDYEARLARLYLSQTGKA